MSKNDPRTITAAERRRRSVALRKEGLSYQAIADELGMARSSVHHTVGKAMATLEKEIEGEARLLGALEMERLDNLQVAIWSRAMEGHLGSVDRVLKIMDRRARLLGLDAPARIAHTTPDGGSDPAAMSSQERRARIAELQAKMGVG